MAQPTIKTITVKGKTRYRFVVDIGPDPKTGKRRQLTRTYDRKRGPGGAEDELAKILNEVNGGKFVAPAKLTVGEHLDEWFRSATRGKEQHTVSSYASALRPVRELYGAKLLQRLTTEDVEDLVDWMLERGRKRGGKPGTGLSPRSVQMTLSRLRAALDAAVRRRRVEFNVAAPVLCPAQTKAKRVPWSPEEVKTLLGSLADERLRPVMLLSLIGMRPAEVCGLRWEHLDLDAGVIDVGKLTRTLVWDGEHFRVEEKGAKSEAGERKLPLPAPVASALKAFKAQQAKERLAAGEAYEPTGYVHVDELGQPRDTAQLRRAAYKLMDAAGVRRVRLYDARHACLTFLRMSGVPGPIVSAWAGHGDLTIADRVYTHPSHEDLRQAGDALATLLGS